MNNFKEKADKIDKFLKIFHLSLIFGGIFDFALAGVIYFVLSKTNPDSSIFICMALLILVGLFAIFGVPVLFRRAAYQRIVDYLKQSDDTPSESNDSDAQKSVKDNSQIEAEFADFLELNKEQYSKLYKLFSQYYHKIIPAFYKYL